MAFSDPQVVTVNAVAWSLAKGDTDKGSTIYEHSTGDVTLTISHQKRASRSAYRARLDYKAVVVNPLEVATNIPVSMSASIIIDAPLVGMTKTSIKDFALGLAAWASSGNILKMLGNET